MKENILEPNGYVIIKNHNSGKILFEGHNMVVKTGKMFIAKKILDGLITNNNEISEANKIKYIYFGSGLSETTYNYDIAEEYVTDNNETLYDNRKIELAKQSESDIDVDVTWPENENYLRIHVENISESVVNNTGTNNISNIILLLSNDDDSNEVIMPFSRVRFDTIKIEAGTSIDLDYYLYF